MTITRWAVSAMTPRSWGDHENGRAGFLLELQHEFQDLRLDRHVECRRRFIGDQHLRVAGERDRDHHPVGASRPTIGAGIHAPDGAGRRCGRARASRRLARRQPLCRARDGGGRFPRSGCRSSAPGSRRSWALEKIIAISCPRIFLSSPSASDVSSCPLKRTLPPVMRARSGGISRTIDRAVTLLPQPDSPTIPKVSPGKSANETPSTARTTHQG